MAITRRNEDLSTAELWKAQLAYVSGTILAWGAVLLQLWPVLARLQTGAHIHALSRDDNAAMPVTTYYLLALLVAVGVGMLVFGAAHIVARGFWFARPLIEAPPATAPASDRVARNTFIVLHMLWATAVVVLGVVPLFALSAVVSLALISGPGWPVGLSRAVAALLIFAAPLAGAVVLYRRRMGSGRSPLRDLVRRIGRWNLATACLTLLLLWLGVLEFSYVANLRLERLVFSRASDPRIVVAVELGGATSDPGPAQVMLVRAGSSAPEPLALRRGRHGTYVSIVDTRTLTSGDYAVTLTYPHGALTPAFPFVRARISREVGFVVVD